MGRPFIDITGKKFGRLLVLSLHHKDKISGSHTTWKCLCDCGNESIVSGHRLKTGKTRSCGCLVQESNHKVPEGEAGFNGLFAAYIIRAKKKDIFFDLTKEQFRSLTEDNCHYCGSEPDNTFKTQHKRAEYKYNGIDRVDNNLGYTMENSVSCCGKCNYMKHAQTEEYFLNHIEKIYKYNNQ